MGFERIIHFNSRLTFTIANRALTPHENEIFLTADAFARKTWILPTNGICFRLTRTWFKLETRKTDKCTAELCLRKISIKERKKEKKRERKSSTDNIVATRSGRDFFPAIDYASSSERSGAKELCKKCRSELVRIWGKIMPMKIVEFYPVPTRLPKWRLPVPSPWTVPVFGNASQQSLQHKLLNILMHSQLLFINPRTIMHRRRSLSFLCLTRENYNA